MIYRALSVQQPWAELIRSGRKTIELRTWTTNYRGPVLICAGRRFDPRGASWEVDGARGMAVCVVELHDIRPATLNDEQAACFPPDPEKNLAWLLRDARAIEPFPVQGRLSLFTVVGPALGEEEPFLGVEPALPDASIASTAPSVDPRPFVMC